MPAKNYTMNPFDAINSALHGMTNQIVRSVMDNGIKKVIFNDPATVVYWGDGVKTVVHCQEGDRYDPRTGLLLCCAKRLLGNTGRYNDILDKALGDHAEPDEGDSLDKIAADIDRMYSAWSSCPSVSLAQSQAAHQVGQQTMGLALISLADRIRAIGSTR